MAKSNISRTSPDFQSATNNFFEARSSYWNDIYRSDDVLGAIVRRRSEVTLGWVDQLRLPPGSTVLEVGCGAGVMAVALAQRGLRVSATDSVPSMLDLTRARAAEAGVSDLVEVREGDVHALGFEDATFDLVIALGVIPWLHSPAGALHEMARVLKPGRVLIVSANNLERLQYLLDPALAPRLAGARRAVKKLLRRRSRSRSDGAHVDARAHAHSREEFERLLTSTGLIKLEGQTFGFGPFTFLHRRILPQRLGVHVHNRLQRLADRGSLRIASRGMQYLVAARRESMNAPPPP